MDTRIVPGDQLVSMLVAAGHQKINWAMTSFMKRLPYSNRPYRRDKSKYLEVRISYVDLAISVNTHVNRAMGQPVDD